MVSNVNIPNTSLQIKNLPADAIVETNAVFERDAIRPVVAGEIPENVKTLIMPHVENHAYTLQAALTCDKELVVKAFFERSDRQKERIVKRKISDSLWMI